MIRPLAFLILAAPLAAGDLESARDLQDRAALDKMAAEFAAAAGKAGNDPEAQYRAALAASFVAEVSLEVRDKEKAQKTAEVGTKAADRAIALKPGVAEYYRVLGTLCGQAIADIKKALELDPKSADAYLWLGLSLRKAHRNAEARQAFQKSMELNPHRVWTKEQLEKTPAS